MYGTNLHFSLFSTSSFENIFAAICAEKVTLDKLAKHCDVMAQLCCFRELANEKRGYVKKWTDVFLSFFLKRNEVSGFVIYGMNDKCSGLYNERV